MNAYTSKLKIEVQPADYDFIVLASLPFTEDEKGASPQSRYSLQGRF